MRIKAGDVVRCSICPDVLYKVLAMDVRPDFPPRVLLCYLDESDNPWSHDTRRMWQDAKFYEVLTEIEILLYAP